MTEVQQLCLAITIVVVWTLWTSRIAWQVYRSRMTQRASAASSLLVGYASQSGQARALAEQRATALQTQALPLSKIAWPQLQACERIELFASTYGEGEAPDNGQAFFTMLKRAKDGALQHLNYCLIGLGDSRYPRFCGFADDLAVQLQRLQARAAEPVRRIDAAKPIMGATANVATWQLVARERLNSERSPGLYLLTLESSSASTWQAGDLLDIVPPATAHEPKPWPRSYSVASVPNEHCLKLIVRQQSRSDGSPGHCSGWLTQELALGQTFAATLSAHPSCQLNDTQAPLLLIGAGSGLAGLRSQIAARAVASNAGPIWLVFGERYAQDDEPLAAELKQWLEQGVVQRIDKVFSRNGEQSAYVQSVLTEHAADVRAFLGAQGHVYLCGSRERLGLGVESALADVLGAEGLQLLETQQRLHRDLY